jgi:hypothetical protein
MMTPRSRARLYHAKNKDKDKLNFSTFLADELLTRYIIRQFYSHIVTELAAQAAWRCLKNHFWT